MQPFRVPELFGRLNSQYPLAADLRAALVEMRSLDRIWFWRLWVTEGIPHAFRDAPGLYEAIREWLATRAEVDPKEITLIGSGRIGYSLAPSEYGRPFGPERDLDFSVISGLLFSRMKGAFEQWKTAVESGLRPRSAAEERYWPENLDRLPRNIARGFVDAYKIPTWYQAPNIVDIMSQLSRKLAVTPACPAFSGAHMRVFRDWPAFVRQAELNLESICRRLSNQGI